MAMQHILGIIAGSSMVMGMLGYVYGVGLGHSMSIVVGVLSGGIMLLAWIFRTRGIS